MYTYIVNICTYNDTYVNLWMITKIKHQLIYHQPLEKNKPTHTYPHMLYL